MKLQDRAFSALNLKQFAQNNELDEIGPYHINCPFEEQYVLRVLILRDGEFKIPFWLKWLEDFIQICVDEQKERGISQPFCYVTVRRGPVKSVKDDEWHVDGFSTRITHLPEQNYILTSVNPTEYVEMPIIFPEDFDPLQHNVHKFFPNFIEDSDIKVMKANTIYAIDPYIIHRRPPVGTEGHRTFIRVSFTPIEINDINNTPNPLLPTNYTKDGVAFREALKIYK